MPTRAKGNSWWAEVGAAPPSTAVAGGGFVVIGGGGVACFCWLWKFTGENFCVHCVGGATRGAVRLLVAEFVWTGVHVSAGCGNSQEQTTALCWGVRPGRPCGC